MTTEVVARSLRSADRFVSHDAAAEEAGTQPIAAIAGSLEAVAVWEFLNRSIDASIIASSLAEEPEVTEEYSMDAEIRRLFGS